MEGKDQIISNMCLSFTGSTEKQILHVNIKKKKNYVNNKMISLLIHVGMKVASIAEKININPL